MRAFINKVAFTLLLAITALSLAGQSIDELRKKKKKTEDEIKRTSKLFEEANKGAKASINKLLLINKSIKLQNNLVADISEEISYLNNSISENREKVKKLSSDIEVTKENYAEMIRYAARNNSADNKILFILSSDNFNQAYERFIYLRQYSVYRRQQIEKLETLQASINITTEELESIREEKEALLQERKNEEKKLLQQKSKQNKHHASLKKQQRELERKLKKQNSAAAKLQSEIEKLIAEEREKESKKLMPEEKLISDEFSKNKGRFICPAEGGLITGRYGEHPHPVHKHVKIRNNGVDITANSGAKARAVFKGRVSKIIDIPGGNISVILRHGNYLTVYSNLANITVKVGQKIDTKQVLGDIFTDSKNGDTILKFQVWRESKKENPENWLAEG